MLIITIDLLRPFLFKLSGTQCGVLGRRNGVNSVVNEVLASGFINQPEKRLV